jgi:hypothetical protein
MTSFFLLFMGPASCSAKGFSGNVDKGWGKKRLIRRQVHPYRNSLTGLIRPVSLYLQTFSSDLFTQRDDLSYRHVVCPGKCNYSCGSVPASLYLWREGLNSEAKEETWIGQFNMRLGV